jgi:hypothetical protein
VASKSIVSPNGTVQPRVAMQVLILLTAGDAVTFTARQNSGGALNLSLKRASLTRITHS